MTKAKKLTVCGLCITIGCILPSFFHMFGLGTVFSPLHFPALLCGLVCGPWYGLACGVLNPLLCSLFTGMPPAARLGYLVPEIACYGFFAGLVFFAIRRKSKDHLMRDLYLALVPALLAGKVIGGIFRAVLFTGGTYTVRLWAVTFFVESLPGIIVQLVTLPLVYLALRRSGLI